MTKYFAFFAAKYPVCANLIHLPLNTYVEYNLGLINTYNVNRLHEMPITFY